MTRDELHGRAVAGVGGLEGGFQLLAVAAPGGPELDERGALPQVAPQLYRRAVQGDQRPAGGLFPHGDPQILCGEGGGGDQQGQGKQETAHGGEGEGGNGRDGRGARGGGRG